MRRSTNKIPLIMDHNPVSAIAEAYRGLRTNIDFAGTERPMQVITVTSALQEEGKTTTAVNLACACAQANKRVLLIDANMRRPMLHHLFRKPNTQGLSNIMAGQCGFRDAVEFTHIDHLELLTAGSMPPNPAELLASSRYAELLAEVKAEYNTIIIDSPSTLFVTDAQIIAAAGDGVLLVADVGKVKKQQVRRAKSLLDNVKAHVIGVVLNNVKAKNHQAQQLAFYM